MHFAAWFVYGGSPTSFTIAASDQRSLERKKVGRQKRYTRQWWSNLLWLQRHTTDFWPPSWFGRDLKNLGLSPTTSYRRGERKAPQSPAYRQDNWAYEAPVPEERPLDVHIQTLWSHVKEHKAYLLELKRSCTIDVFCGYRSNSRIAGFEVSAESLEMFVELDIPFGVSVIITPF
jgi:hypothetical protein